MIHLRSNKKRRKNTLLKESWKHWKLNRKGKKPCVVDDSSTIEKQKKISSKWRRSEEADREGLAMNTWNI